MVLVQHLAPLHESALPTLLAGRTHLSVQQAVEGMRVEVNRVYVIPPNVQMGIVEDVLHLQPRPRDRSQYYALKPSGFLVLGSAESIGQHVDLFAAVQRRLRIYHRKAGGVPEFGPRAEPDGAPPAPRPASGALSKTPTLDQGNEFSLRIRPYKDLENRIDGAVLALCDTQPRQPR